GKTTLAEGLLFKMGSTTKWFKPAEKNSVLDYEADARDRGGTIDAGFGFGKWKKTHLNLVDTPGASDFAGATVGGLAAVETAAVVIAANQGVSVNTRKGWALARRAGQPRIIVVTKIDAENVAVDALIAAIRATFGAVCNPLQVPIGAGEAVSGLVNVLTPAADAPADARKKAESFAEGLKSAIYEADDELVTRYLEGGEISADETNAAFCKAIWAGTVCPILFTSSAKAIGFDELLNFIVTVCPSPAMGVRAKLVGADGAEAAAPEPDAAKPLLGRVVRTLIDPVIGKINFIRVYQGTLARDVPFADPAGGKPGKMMPPGRPLGKERKEVGAVGPGDIVAVPKIDALSCGDTVRDPAVAGVLEPLPFPRPMVMLAVEPAEQKDIQKLGDSLRKLAQGDPTFNVNRDPRIQELTTSGLTDLHLRVMLERLHTRFKVACKTKPPRIPYRETINGKGESRYRHKKQTGGAGQFAEVAIRVRPAPRGGEDPLVFKNDIFGGAISGNYVPSVEKGVRDRMSKGVLAGYPVVDVEVSLWDGKEHPVDSKDVAFQTAGKNAFREAFLQANPGILEPYAIATITIPNRFLGEITSDLNSVRRGRVIGMDAEGDFQVIKARVPLSEMQNYASSLRAMTQGEGDYVVEPSEYDILPKHLEARVIAGFKAEVEE
ncbi:MAG: elongation factor G, partial [Planctomycetes bacterium]|nr:elongation factor G [Planctomycetota bacterium]